MTSPARSALNVSTVTVATRLAGLKGKDTLDGSAGSDTLDYSAAGNAVTAKLDDDGEPEMPVPTRSSRPRTWIGSALADTLTGTSVADTLRRRRRRPCDRGRTRSRHAYRRPRAAIPPTIPRPASVSSSTSPSLAPRDGGAGTDTLTGIENLTGGAGRDTLRGSTPQISSPVEPGTTRSAAAGAATSWTPAPASTYFDYASSKDAASSLDLTTGLATAFEPHGHARRASRTPPVAARPTS